MLLHAILVSTICTTLNPACPILELRKEKIATRQAAESGTATLHTV